MRIKKKEMKEEGGNKKKVKKIIQENTKYKIKSVKENAEIKY